MAKKTNAVMKNFFIISLVGDGLTFRTESAGILAVFSPIRTRFDLVDKCILLGVNKRLKKPLILVGRKISLLPDNNGVQPIKMRIGAISTPRSVKEIKHRRLFP